MLQSRRKLEFSLETYFLSVLPRDSSSWRSARPALNPMKIGSSTRSSSKLLLLAARTVHAAATWCRSFVVAAVNVRTHYRLLDCDKQANSRIIPRIPRIAVRGINAPEVQAQVHGQYWPGPKGQRGGQVLPQIAARGAKNRPLLGLCHCL